MESWQHLWRPQRWSYTYGVGNTSHQGLGCTHSQAPSRLHSHEKTHNEAVGGSEQMRLSLKHEIIQYNKEKGNLVNLCHELMKTSGGPDTLNLTSIFISFLSS